MLTYPTSLSVPCMQSNDIDENEQPFEKPTCAATVRVSLMHALCFRCLGCVEVPDVCGLQWGAPILPCGLYRGGIPQYHWDVLVMRQCCLVCMQLLFPSVASIAFHCSSRLDE